MQMSAPYMESPHSRKLSIVGDHASYMQISRSMRIASTAELPNGGVAHCRIPNKEIILLAYMTMSSEYGQMAGMSFRHTVREQKGESIRIKQDGVR